MIACRRASYAQVGARPCCTREPKFVVLAKRLPWLVQRAGSIATNAALLLFLGLGGE